MSIGSIFLTTAVKRFEDCKKLADKTFIQLREEDFNYQPNEASNSIAIIMQHMSGNMLSRWTNFLTEDGEKEWRHRDDEFEPHAQSKEALVGNWEKGWSCMFDALHTLTEEDLTKTVYIRQEGLSVIDAIHRQMIHYASHVGQIMYLGKLIKDQEWKSLSIPKGQSDAFNKGMKQKG